MPLCIKLKRHGQDDGIVTLQKQETSKERQNLKIVDSRIQCASTIFLSVITESPATAGDNIPTVHTGTKYSKDHGRKYSPKDKKQTNPGLCILIFCVTIVMAKVILHVIVVGDKCKNQMCRVLIIIHRISKIRAINHNKIVLRTTKMNHVGRMITRVINNPL